MVDYFAGIDAGSVTTKSVIIADDRKVLGRGLVQTGISGAKASKQALDMALSEAGIGRESLRRIIATGYGRKLVDFADARTTEITCHARGAFEKQRSALTLIDIGGQDSKAISIDSGGRVKSFVMNDKCAAGTGRFIEVMARVLETDIVNMSEIALSAKNTAIINSLCTVFAETEVVGLLAQGAPRDEIARGLFASVAERVGSMARKVGVNKNVYISGGVAKIPAVVCALTEYLGTEVSVIENPQLNGAFGAAIIAGESQNQSWT